MRKRKKRQENDELNFWQPASDMFSALLLILMLVILLLGLYLVHIPEYDQPDAKAGDTYGGSETGADNANGFPTFTPLFFQQNNGEGTTGETPHPTYYDFRFTTSPSPSPAPTVSPTPDLPGGGAAGGGGGEGGGEGAGEGRGDEPDLGLKSAVFVMIVDAETDRTIKEANVEFELYGENSAIQILNTYYPERITYRFYETTDQGTFYLPEKLQLGAYVLHELTEPAGYDAAENQAFIVDQIYDWPDPYVVRVPVTPSRNIIRVQMTDVATGAGIPGGSFAVIAAENIITADGTLRYRAGQTVCEIVCDDTGYGESEEIYLGKYTLRQRDIPLCYVGMQDDLEVEVTKKSKALPPIQTVASARTKIHLSLADELYPTRPIAGAMFRISADGTAEQLEITTDARGEFTLDALKKATVYRITQADAVGDYVRDPVTYSVTVSADGRIQGEEEISLNLFNHIIRVAIGITDEFSSVQVPNVNLALYDAGGTLVRTWTTTGSALNFTDLQPGKYSVIKDGDASTRYDIHVVDQAEVQTVNLHTTYVMHYLIMGAAAAFILALIILIIVLVRRRRKRRRN